MYSMSTTRIAAALFRLQQLDFEADRLQAEHQAIQNSLQGNAELQKLHSKYNRAKQQVQSALQAQKEAEWALEDIATRLKAQEQRLYSGSAVNPKDLQFLQQEVQHLLAQQNRQEEVVLETIETAEALQEQAQQVSEMVKQAEEVWQEECSTLIARRDKLNTHKQELQTRRSQATSEIAGDVLVRYDMLRRTKQGKAVSKIEQNSCQWCRVILTPSDLQHVRINSNLQTCTNCGRILYYDR